MEIDLSYILLVISSFSLVKAATRYFSRNRLLEGVCADGPRPIKSCFGKLLIGVANRLPVRATKIFRKFGTSKLCDLIAISGYNDMLTAESFYASRLIIAIMGAVVGPIVLPFHVAQSVVAGAVLCWFAASVWLKKCVRMRTEAIERALPNTFDWLSLTVEAGIDFAEAITRVATRIKEGPLKDELTLLHVKIGMGVSRKDALAELVRRSPIPALVSSVSLLIQADRMGTSIGPILKSQSERLKNARLARAEKKGALAAQKALLPLAFCIMPATFVIVFGPLIVRLLNGGLSSLF